MSAPEWEVVVTEGRNDAAVKVAVDEALSRNAGTRAQARVVLPPGDYHLTKSVLDWRNKQLEGFGIRGMGKRSTRLFFDAQPAATVDPWKNNLISASGLRFLELSGFTAISANPFNSFAYLWGTWDGSFNNRWAVRDVEWQGSWLRGFGLDGDDQANLNSELTIDDCETSPTSRFGDAFFVSGGISGTYNQQNQFVNTWVTNCNLSMTQGTGFKLVRGGSLRVERGSWSAGSKDVAGITWFSMSKRNLNNRGATQLSVRDIRFEPKRPDHLVIDCRWGSGSVTFEDCVDLCSAAKDTAPYNADWNLHRYYGENPWGRGGMIPTVRYRSHQGVGHHLYSGPAVKYGSIGYDGCYWWRGASGQTVTKADALRWTDGAPRVQWNYNDNLEG